MLCGVDVDVDVDVAVGVRFLTQCHYMLCASIAVVCVLAVHVSVVWKVQILVQNRERQGLFGVLRYCQ